MIRLVEIPDNDIDNHDLAMWLMFFPDTMGFGYLPQFKVSRARVLPIFSQHAEITPIFSASVETTPIFTHDTRVNEELKGR